MFVSVTDIAKLVGALLATNNLTANLKLIELKTIDVLLVSSQHHRINSDIILSVLENNQSYY